MRLPNPQGKGKGKGTGTSTRYDATGKLVLLWVPGQNQIDLLTLTECLICFHDRFYTIDEIAVLIKAVKSNQHEFTIFCYDGEKYCIVQHEILPIMAELAALFGKEIPKSRSSNERSYPTLTNQGELRVPREASGLGRRQLNELLVNTPYFRRHPEYYMDKRIGQSGHQRITTSAPASDRRPPPPPLSPARRGRSSDESAGTASTERTRSPIARHRPTETHISTSGSEFFGDRPQSSAVAGSSTDVRPREPAGPPPRRVNRDLSEYISDADWDAIRNDRAFEATAPGTAASPPPSEAPSSAVDLTSTREWSEPNRRRPHDPPTFGVFFETRGLSDREMRMREVVVDYFDQLQSAGLFYPNFRLGFDITGELIDPSLARRPEWNRVDQYQWAVLAAMTERIVQPSSIIYMIPSYGNLHGFTFMDSSHVQWYLSGWNRETYNYRTGRRDRVY